MGHEIAPGNFIRKPKAGDLFGVIPKRTTYLPELRMRSMQRTCDNEIAKLIAQAWLG